MIEDGGCGVEGGNSGSDHNTTTNNTISSNNSSCNNSNFDKSNKYKQYLNMNFVGVTNTQR